MAVPVAPLEMCLSPDQERVAAVKQAFEADREKVQKIRALLVSFSMYFAPSRR